MLTDFGSFEGVQPDGKLVAAGSGARAALARYNPDGSLDRSFGKDGRVRPNVRTGIDLPRALVLQPDGKLVAAGESFLARFNPNGSLDASFGAGGVARTVVICWRRSSCSQMENW